MKKLYFLFALVLFSYNLCFAQQAKYVFYFIGDGMGVNQVQGTELFQGELNGKIAIEPLCFTQFPVSTVATTFSATNGVTDSAAAGTALATGNKTKNGAIGVLKDLETPVNSVAVWAKNSGRRVGIATRQVEAAIITSVLTSTLQVLISMPALISWNQKTKRTVMQRTSTKWQTNTAILSPEDIRITPVKAQRQTR